MSSAPGSIRMYRASGPKANSPSVGMQYCPTSRTTSALISAIGAASADSSWSAGNCPFIAPDSHTGMCARSASLRSASHALL